MFTVTEFYYAWMWRNSTSVGKYVRQKLNYHWVLAAVHSPERTNFIITLLTTISI